MEHKQYKVGIYCRLSKDDVCIGNSSSIQSQKAILEKYVKENNWTVFDHYIDDGYSGTNFDRPAFHRMLEDIETGRINMIIVKDLSRLGRNYLMTGQYTDLFFPDRGIRFIALNDGIDTRKTDNDITPFKNILNEMYSRDISRKVRSAVKIKKQRGEFLSNFAPYGYKRDTRHKNRLIVEESSAAVVRRIFDMSKNGLGSRAIARTLTEEGVLTPINHRAKLHGSRNRKIPNIWNAESVNNILRSRYYIGDMVQGIYECSLFKRKPSKLKPREEWYITSNTHEALVAVETWNRVQTCISSRKRVSKNNEIQLFAGFVKCGSCGHALSYSYSHGLPQYTCGLYRRHGKKACSCHYVRKDKLEKAVLEDIWNYAQFASNNREYFMEQLMSLDNKHVTDHIEELRKKLEAATTRTEELDAIIKQLYEDLIAERLTNGRFNKLLSGFEEEQTELNEVTKATKIELCNIQKTEHSSDAWLNHILGYADIQKLDRIALSDLINKISVGETRLMDGEKLTDVKIQYQYESVVHHIIIKKEK